MGISDPGNAQAHFYTSGALLRDLRCRNHRIRHVLRPLMLLVSEFFFDTVNLTMSVMPERLKELQSEILPAWIDKRYAMKAELQSLVGKLSFVSKCV